MITVRAVLASSTLVVTLKMNTICPSFSSRWRDSLTALDFSAANSPVNELRFIELVFKVSPTWRPNVKWIGLSESESL